MDATTTSSLENVENNTSNIPHKFPNGKTVRIVERSW